MNLQRSPYEVLGVPPSATSDEIKKKYRELARKFHPDLVADKALGQKVFTQINQAYRILGDIDRRAEYDSAQRATRPKRVPSKKIVSNAVPSEMRAPDPIVTSAATDISRDNMIAKMLADAEMSLLRGQAVQAQTICLDLLDKDTRNVKALMILGDALVYMKKPQEAAIAFKSALQIAPSSLIQAKLNQVTQQAAPASKPAGTPPPPAQRPVAAQTPPPAQRPPAKPTPAAPPKSGGLLGRLLNRK